MYNTILIKLSVFVTPLMNIHGIYNVLGSMSSTHRYFYLNPATILRIGNDLLPLLY